MKLAMTGIALIVLFAGVADARAKKLIEIRLGQTAHRYAREHSRNGEEPFDGLVMTIPAPGSPTSASWVSGRSEANLDAGDGPARH